MLLTTPSYYSLMFTGLFSLLIIIIAARNFKRLNNLKPEMRIKLIGIIGILIGLHGLLHLGFETIYNYNPLENKY